MQPETNHIEWIRQNIPEDATPREVAILVCYHVLGIKEPNTLAKLLHYKDNSTIHRKLKKYRTKVFTYTGHCSVTVRG